MGRGYLFNLNRVLSLSLKVGLGMVIEDKYLNDKLKIWIHFVNF